MSEPRSEAAGPDLSIVVVTWECAGALEKLVASLNGHLDGGQELIVVDNASSDDPEAAAKGWKGPGWYLQMERNHGFGAGINAGVAQASGEAVVVLNPDAELVDDGLPRLAGTALRLGALVGPRVLNRDGSAQPSASGPPVGAWPWLRAVLPSPVGPRAVLARTAPWRLESLTRVAWLTGCCVAGPREVLRALGPFDPAIHLYGEDLDLALRAEEAGVPSFFAPETCTVIHDGKVSSRRLYDDFGRGESGLHGRVVLRRRYGARRERLAWWAERANLRLRVTAKALLRREHGWDSLVLAGLRDARTLPSVPADPESRLQDPPEALSRRRLGASGR